MAKLGQLDYNEGEFDRNRAGFVPLPDGAYNVEIVDCTQKKWDDGDVQLSVTYKVIDGDHEGRTIYDNLRLVNRSNDVQGIARAALHKICDNLEINFPPDDDQLLIGGMQTIVLRSKAKAGKTYQNIAQRDALQTGRVRQVATAGAAKPTTKTGVNSSNTKDTDAPW